MPETLFDFDDIEGLCTADSGAYFSPNSEYRYALWRRWDQDKPWAAIYGLNPSDADEFRNDMTITKCIGFAKRWGCGGIYMLNLYAFVSTQPSGLFAAADPIGPGNDEAITEYSKLAQTHVVAWGSVDLRHRVNLQWQTRIAKVLELIGRPVLCLGRTQDGSPRHPSRIAYDTPLEPWSR